jgi:hypothetical protein
MFVNVKLAYVIPGCETQSRAIVHVFSKSHVPSFNYLHYMEAYIRVDSSVGTVGNVGLDLGVRWERCLYLVESIQRGCGVLTATYSIDTFGSFGGGNWPELEPVHSPLSSAMIMNLGMYTSTAPVCVNCCISARV